MQSDSKAKEVWIKKRAVIFCGVRPCQPRSGGCCNVPPVTLEIASFHRVLEGQSSETA